MTTIISSASNGLSRSDREQLLQQNGIVIWLTGLSGAGKTTIARALEKELHQQGVLTKHLDGDQLRTGLNHNLGFTETDRLENIRRAAEVARLFVESGVVTICCFISPTEKIRKVARDVIGDKDYFEVYVNTPLEVCEQRDVKGLYKKARRGEIGNFTGIHTAYEAPESPALEVNPEEGNLAQIVGQILSAIRPIINF